MDKKLAAICCTLALLLTGCSTGQSSRSAVEIGTAQEVQAADGLTVTVLKAGKADAIVIRTAEHCVVIDCGEKGDGKKVVKCLQAYGVETIDCLIFTHYDQDHIGGGAKVLRNFPVQRVIAPDYEENSEEYRKLCDQMTENGLAFEYPQETVYFTLDDAEFTVYPCQAQTYASGSDNNHSIVTKVVHHDNVMLFTGDAMDERLSEIMDIGGCDLLKVPYHGRELDMLPAFLDAVTPEYAVICTSQEEMSGITMQALNDRDIETYITYKYGNIVVTSDGSTLTFETSVEFGD